MKQTSLRKTVLTTTMATGVLFTSPLVIDAALGDQTLKSGMNHTDVKELQDLLKEKGYFDYHTSTGYYGTITEEAVKQFQRDNGIQSTGVAGKQTLTALLQVSSANNGETTKPTQRKVLTLGAQGDEVKKLQQLLKEQGHFNHKVTGYFGRVTAAAVKEFQLKNELTVDGIVGEQTKSALTLQPMAIATSTRIYQPSSQVSSTSSTSEILRIGAKGEQVIHLQKLLKDAGFFNREITGNFGEVTEQVVKEFQRQNGLAIDGIVGPKTIGALNQSASINTPQTTTGETSQEVKSTSILKHGDRSQAVASLQTQLQSLGYFSQEPTGYFGTVTETAVRKFQQDQLLKNTGQVDSETKARLLEQVAIINMGQASTTKSSIINIVADAAELVGVPYQWGGTTPDGFDCSGFLTYVFKKNGVTLPRTVAAMYQVGEKTNEPQVGDLLFFETYTEGPSHAGIYIGNQQFVHSGTSTGVTVSSLHTPYWSERYLGAKRYK
ncbi:C40 family peptidase [Bacillus sp. FJAT-45350]|uniref:C40 family peptidase n=1 Tax=Bacillus sp. FJAT-45350 TaxID=2011014 RepID=UPI000BB819A3|nr:peptidoglycan-binding protein [Bacillus sp. FJAT-45350]